jgi:5-methylthioadenosine/S-adenosylhomocysteine deaminase
MLAADELARSIGSPFHTHILETKTQAVTGPEFHGKTLIRYMHDLGQLHAGTTIARSIWVTDEDIALMGDAGCSIVHNVISNQKLGAGIAPLRKLLDAGVNVALGSDGICSNDTARMFDVMHAAGLLHSVSSPDYDTWAAYQPAHTAIEAENAVFHPYFAAIHKRCTSMDVGINRYGSDMPAWKGHNRRLN